MAEHPPTGRMARGAIVGLAVARAGVAQLSHKAQVLALTEARAEAARAAHQARLGRILFGALNQLKGTALKAAQLLSMELGLLPEPLREQLARAHFQATPLNRALVIKLLRQEFGQGPEQLFAQFEPQAFAAASLGQVHRASLPDGQPLAVKLQYPGMAASIRSDLALLRSLLGGLGQGAQMPEPALLERLLGEIEAKLAEELDYRQEADALDWFADRLAHLPELVLPRPLRSHSSARVLCMQHLQGLHLHDWLATGPSQAERDRVGQLLWDLFMHSVFVLRRLQADPHPGNYLFMPDGRLGLLDFGCTRDLSEDFVQGLTRAWTAHLAGEPQGLHLAYQGLGLIAPGLTRANFERELLPCLRPVLDWQLLPWRSDHHDFSVHPPPPRMSRDTHAQAMRHLHGMPPELPFFDRAHLGLVQMLKSLGARVRTSPGVPILPS